MMTRRNNMASFMFTILVCSNFYIFLGNKHHFLISTVTCIESSKNKVSNPYNNNKVNTVTDKYGLHFENENDKFTERVLLKKHRQQERKQQHQQQQQNVWYDESIDRFARTTIDNTYQMHMEYDESRFYYENNSTIRSKDVQCDEAFKAFTWTGQVQYYDSKTDDSTNNSIIEDGDLIVSDGKYVYAAYGKYLVAINLSTGKIVRTVEIPKNNLTKPFFCGTGRYDEGLMWLPFAKIESLSLHNDRLMVIVSGYFENNDDENRIDRTISAYMSTLVQIYDTNIIVQKNSSYTGILGSNYINGYFKFARSIQNTVFVVTQSLLNTEPLLELPFRRYGEKNVELTDDEYTTLVRSKTDEQTELFQQMLFRDLTSENSPLPTIANINISLYDKSMTEEDVYQYIHQSKRLLFVHSIDIMIKQSEALVVKKSVGILVQGYDEVEGSDNIIIMPNRHFDFQCQKSLIYVIQLAHNRSTPTQTTVSIAVVPGVIHGSTNIFQQTLIRAQVEISCHEQKSNAPSDIPSNIPSSVPFVVPNNISSDITSNFLSDVPSDNPSVAPIHVSSDIPSNDSFSDFPSNIPSIVPSEAPSKIPSNLPSIATSMQTTVEHKKYMIIWNISSDDVDFLEKDKRPGSMEEVSRIEFEHDNSQFFENTVYGITYLETMHPHTYYDFTDPYLPKDYTEYAFNAYGSIIHPLNDDQQYGNNSEIILLLGMHQDNSNLINMVDMSNPQNPVSLHNFTVPISLTKTDKNGKEYQEYISWNYFDSRYNNDGLFFVPITVNLDYVNKTIRKRGYTVFLINKEDGIKELNQCRMFVGEPEVQYYNRRKLDIANDERKCYYCYGPSIRERSMRYDDGKKWLITGSNFAMINIDYISHNNTMTTCDKVWEETIEFIPALDDQAPNCCTEQTFNDEYCCL